MTPMKLLKAFEFLEEDLIMDVATEPSKRRRRLLPRPMLIAAILLAGILAITACTAMGGTAWFLQYFSNLAQNDLSVEQVEYIVANTIDVNKSRTVNGYTLTLKSAFSDGRIILMQFDLTAPEGKVLDADKYVAAYETVFRREDTPNLWASMSWELWDEDKTDNKTSIVCSMDFLTDEDMSNEFVGHTCQFYIYGLKEVAWLEPKELGTREEKLAEGCWSFDIYFPEDCNRTVAFVQEPVTVTSTITMGYEPVGENLLQPITEEVEVAITALNLRTLSAELGFHYGDEPRNGDFRDLYVVMKDGSRILMKQHYGATDYITYQFETPLVLDNVDYILFPDGTRVYAP